MNSVLRDYCESVVSGEITACEKIKTLCGIILNDLDGKGLYSDRYHFDESKALRPVEFIERFCRQPSGKIGKPLVLEPFQRAFIECIFGFVDDDGIRRYQEALFVVGRKNGKSSLAAALELYMLVADGEGSPQIYNVATKFEQAMLGFDAALKMIRQSPDLRRVTKKRAGDIFAPKNMGYIKPLSNRTENLDGLDIHMAVIDELAAIQNRDLFDLMKQGTAAREQPLILQITTNGFVRNGIFDSQYDYAARWLKGELEDEHFIAWIYELDQREEWEMPECWIKANPGLGTIKKTAALRGYVNKAKNDSSFLPTVLTKDFNIPENNAVAWLTFEEAVNEETFDVEKMGFRYGICGFDASETIDLTCAQMLIMRPNDDKIYVRSMYWIPEDVIREYDDEGKRRERDDVPYKQWIARGLMRTVPGNRIDKRVVLEWLVELRDQEDIYPFAIGYDPWHLTDDALRADFQSFVGKTRAFEIRQGPQTLSGPMKQLRADYKANRIVDNHNPINEWCRMNVEILTDTNGNIKPDKKRNNPKNRIDGFMAELDAYIVLDRIMDEYQANI